VLIYLVCLVLKYLTTRHLLFLQSFNIRHSVGESILCSSRYMGTGKKGAGRELLWLHPML
ncbi:hypothetical protein, partial [Pseudomonas viridiflava]|uniref:hypothetical protein n=1 Tax=Pseudomonas viridiflava TaxID=33069 RepID=UPI00197FE46B